MYQQFYGLRELPFELTPNPKFLFLTTQHREALSTLLYGLSTAKGVTALIGEAGMGKTTLLHAALQSDKCRHVTCVHLVNPTLTRSEFLEVLSVKFGLSPHARESKAGLLQELDAVLRARRARGQLTALMVDESQSLSNEILEEIRLLANTETATEKLLSLVLAGQPEFKDRLNENALRQLKQRVTLRCEITPFTLQDTAAYIAWRIRTAGGDAARVFTREAVMLIHERSGGIPRTISVICDNALLTGFGLGRQPVDYEMVSEVARDFDLPDLRSRRVTPLESGPSGVRHARVDPPVVAVAQKPEQEPDRATAPAADDASTIPAAVPDQSVLRPSRTTSRFSLFGIS